MEWFKFYNNKWLTDLAILSLDPLDRLCFITLLCIASSSDERNGVITQYHEHRILTLTHLSPEEYNKCVGLTHRLVDSGIIEEITSNEIKIKNFEKRQNTMLSGAERAKKYRERQKVTKVTNKSDESNARVEKSREDKKRVDKSIEVSKDTYGEFKNVNLSKEEYEKLITMFSEKNTLILIEELSGYIASKRKNYASHYATLLNWGRRRIQDYKEKNNKRTII